VEYIHGIQFLPFTPITELLLVESWVHEEYPVLAAALTRGNPPLADPWKGFIVGAQAIIDKQGAWTSAMSLNGWDNGNSKTNLLHWIATRP
jgi:endo-1,3(4)-beta-glucanase